MTETLIGEGITVPRLEDIEQFKSDLNALGHEPSILAERGERLEDVAVPEQGLDEDLDALLNAPDENFPLPGNEDETEESIFGVDTGEDQLPPSTQEEEDDFSIPEDLLSDFNLDEDDEDSPEGTEDVFEEESGVEDEFALPDDFDFMDEEAPVPAAEEESGGTEDAFDDASGAEDEFALPDDFDFMDEEAPVAAAEEKSEGTEDAFDDAYGAEDEFALPDDFDFMDEEEPVAAEGEESPGTEDAFGDAAGGEDEFALPDDFEFSDEEGPAESLGEDEFEIPEEFADAADILDLDSDGESFTEDESASVEEMEDFTVGEDEDFSLPEELSFEENEPGSEEVQAPLAEDEELSFFDEEAEEADFSMPEDFPFEEPAVQDADDSGGVDDFDIPSAGDIEDIDENNFEVDEFSLGDLGEQFGELEESFEIASEEQLNPALAVSEELPQGDEVLELNEEDFAALQETLNRQPLNLKIAIEELVGEKNLSGAHLQKLVRALVDGKSSKDLAALVGTITGKKIKIPTRYEKSTGTAFQEEKGTFAYAFRHTILPVLRVAAAVLVAVGLLAFLSYTFVYRPVHSMILYNAGYKQLEQDAYREANLFFDNAVEEWRYKSQYFRFAEAFADRRQYSLAGGKYEALLAPVLIRRNGRLEKHPEVAKVRGSERRAILDYAAMETDKTENFEHSEELLDVLLAQERHDYDALLASGDNYLAWGEYDYERYEDARYEYAVLMQHYGQKFELLFRMLRYFIRTDNYKEVKRIKDQFEATEKLKIEPDAYAELGGYLIDKNDLDDVRGILTRTLETDPELSEGHYHLARYFRRVDNPEEERKALDYAQHYFEQSAPLGKRKLKMMIDTYDRQGEVDYADGQYLTAEENYLKARDQYEDGLERRVLEPEALFGRIYRNLGNLYYYVAAEFDNAFDMFIRAEDAGYKAPEINYKKGYIYYNKEEYQDALAEFYLAADVYSANENLLFATGNALFHRSDYFAAQGYYTHLLDELEQRRRDISVLLPYEREEDRSLIERLLRTNNNLGVTLQRLSLASGDREKFSRALVHFTDSAENFDLLRREPESMQRGSAVNLGYLNQRAMLYPVENYDLQIYTDLPMDLESLKLE